MTTTTENHAQVWVDHLGTVHERFPDQPGRTLCGMNAGTSNRVLRVLACRACIAEHLATETPQAA